MTMHSMNETNVVLVLMGGPDAEREVSMMSGREVAAGLRESGRYRVIEKVIDRPDAAELRAMIDASDADVVFPVLHGQWGEGGPLQELLEEVGAAYVGSRPKAAALAMNKIATKTMLARQLVPTPRARQLAAGDPCDLEPPLVIKPVDDGSSVGLRICRSATEIQAARDELHVKRPMLMAEEYIAGREVTVGVLLDEPLPMIEIVPAAEFYDYEAKYTREDTRYDFEPDLPEPVKQRCVDFAMIAYRTIGCRDVARVDLMVDDRGPWFLEINTMPGFTSHSLVPKAAAAKGWPMAECCAMLVEAARARSVQASKRVNV